MHRRVFTSWAFVLASSGCGGGAPAPHDVARAPTRKANGVPVVQVDVRCTAATHAREVLLRHARAFGSAAALEAELPLTLHMHEALEGKTGDAELALDPRFHRLEEVVAGVHHAQGVDANGPWLVDIAGVPNRLAAGEAGSIAFDEWLVRRAYVAAFDPKRDSATCSADRRAIVLRYRLPELGSPELELDVATGALVTAAASTPDGRRTSTRYASWSDADRHGVRFPAATEVTDGAGNRTKILLRDVAPGLACPRGGETPSPIDCFAPPKPKLTFSWPASGVVRVPMKHYLGELSLRVRLGERDAWALLDSGAGLTIVDATTPAGAAFVPALEVTGSGSSQKIRAGVGELATLRIGELSLEHLPCASVPIPALDGFGDRRPEVVVGFSVFMGAAVRVDYAKQEIALAPSVTALVGRNAERVALRVLDGKPVADAVVEGVPAPFLVDTGNAGGIDMIKTWADAHGFPGQRPTVDIVAKTGAGGDETRSTTFRLAQASFGPIRHDDRLVEIDDPPQSGILAGLIGNEVFSHCAAIVFDVPGRALWVEPPCDRPSAESKSGWRLTKRDASSSSSRAFPDRPWVIEKIVPGGSAAKAGLEVGDRILAVDGVPAELDVAKIQAIVERAEGTKVVVELERKGARKQVTMVLRRLLAP